MKGHVLSPMPPGGGLCARACRWGLSPEAGTSPEGRGNVPAIGGVEAEVRLSKKVGSQALRPKTPFRVGRALRLDVNLLTGSVRIVSNRIFRNKGGGFVFRNLAAIELIGGLDRE